MKRGSWLLSLALATSCAKEAPQSETHSDRLKKMKDQRKPAIDDAIERVRRQVSAKLWPDAHRSLERARKLDPDRVARELADETK